MGDIIKLQTAKAPLALSFFKRAATSNEANQLTATRFHRANRFLLRLIRNHSLLIAVRFLKTLEEVLGLANNHA